jgi:superoxide reductase
MSELNQVYKCPQCQQMVTVIGQGGGVLTCCAQPMELVKENVVNAAKEKHVPVIAKSGDGYTVKVGEVQHPSEEKHYIEWIELESNGIVQRKYLQPGAPPEAVFEAAGGSAVARAYCNLHGLWKSPEFSA